VGTDQVAVVDQWASDPEASCQAAAVDQWAFDPEASYQVAAVDQWAFNLMGIVVQAVVVTQVT